MAVPPTQMKHQSLKLKLSVAIVALALFPVVLLGGYQSFTRYNSLKASLQSKLISDLEAQQNAISRFFAGASRDVEFLAGITEIESLLTGIEDEDLDEIEFWTDSLGDVLISFAENREIFSELRFSPGVDREMDVAVLFAEGTATPVTGAPLPAGFEEALGSDAPQVTWTSEGKGCGIWLHYPVEEGDTHGLVSARLAMSHFFDVIANEEAYLIDASGQWIVDHGEVPAAEPSRVLPTLLGQEARSPSEGETCFYSFNRFAPFEWVPSELLVLYVIRTKQEIMSAVHAGLWEIAVICLGSLGVVLICGFLIVRATANPILGMAEVMMKLAEGELDVVLPPKTSATELIRMSEALQVFKTNAIEQRKLHEETKRLEHEQRSLLQESRQHAEEQAQQAAQIHEHAELERERERERAREQELQAERERQQSEELRLQMEAMQKLEATQKEAVERERLEALQLREKVDALLEVVDSAATGDLTRPVTVHGDDAIGLVGQGLQGFFDSLAVSLLGISSAVGAIEGSSRKMSDASQLMSANAEETSAQADVVSKAAGHVKSKMTSGAHGTQEMAEHLRMVSQNAEHISDAVTDAVKQSEDAAALVTRLAKSSDEIGSILEVISAVAHQTNLLALNATIEAAAAGEAGKGFAVVAQEVKDLAHETTKATKGIAKMIHAIQTDTQEATDSIHGIGKTVGSVDESVSRMTSMLSNLSSTSAALERDIVEAAHRSEDIAENMSGMTTAAQSTSEAATTTLAEATEILERTHSLASLIERFQCAQEAA